MFRILFLSIVLFIFFFVSTALIAESVPVPASSVPQLKKRALYHRFTFSWPNGVVPYHFHSSVGVNERLITENAMKYLERVSGGGVRFKSLQSARDQN